VTGGQLSLPHEEWHHWRRQEFSFVDIAQWSGDETPSMGSGEEAPLKDEIPQKLKQFADIVCRF